jgi:hypothetical protein
MVAWLRFHTGVDVTERGDGRAAIRVRGVGRHDVRAVQVVLALPQQVLGDACIAPVGLRVVGHL